MAEGDRLLPRYYLQKQVAFNVDAGDATYLFDLASCPADPNVVAASASNHRLKAYDRSTLKLTRSLPAVHKARVTGLSFARASPNLLWSCSQDQAVVLWDLRTGGGPSLSYEAHEAVPSCLGVSCDDSAVAVGSDTVNEEVAVLVYDVRAAAAQAVLSDLHSDDITSVSFHPDEPSVCVTGSTDGLVNVVDLRRVADEDEVVQTLNTESSVARCGFFGLSGEFVHALTHIESFWMWHATPRDDEEESELISRFDGLRDGLAAQGVAADYFVDAVFQRLTSRLFLVAGTHAGNVDLLHVNLDSIDVAASLHGGHAATVRAVYWDCDGSGAVVSGAEDAKLALWTDVRPPAQDASRAAAEGKVLPRAGAAGAGAGGGGPSPARSGGGRPY